MTGLITCLSTGKGTWGHVGKVIEDKDWDKIIVITNDFGKEKFSSEKETELVIVNANAPMSELIDTIKAGIEGKFSDMEVALNIASGSGKEHMATISAILKAGLSFRLVALTKEGVQEI